MCVIGPVSSTIAVIRLNGLRAAEDKLIVRLAREALVFSTDRAPAGPGWPRLAIDSRLDEAGNWNVKSRGRIIPR